MRLKKIIFVFLFILHSNYNLAFGSSDTVKFKYCKVETVREYTRNTNNVMINGENKGFFGPGDKIKVVSYLFDDEQDLKSCEDFEIQNQTYSYKQTLNSITEVSSSEYENYIMNAWASYLPTIGINFNQNFKIQTPKKENIYRFEKKEIFFKKENLIGYCMIDPITTEEENNVYMSNSFKKRIYNLGFTSKTDFALNETILIMTCNGKEEGFINIPVVNGTFNMNDLQPYTYISKSKFTKKKETIKAEENKKAEEKRIVEEKRKSDCNVKKFKDILNCDLSTVVDVCDEFQRVYVKSFERINFTKRPNNRFLMYSLNSCKGTFGGIFGMGTSVYASYKWDIKKHKFKDDRISNLLEKREKVNMVLIHLSDHNKDKFKELYDYLKKNYKSSGNINKTSEVIDGKKNFVLWSFDNSRVLLILTPNYLGDGWTSYLAYVHPESVSEIINSFLETDTSNSQL